MDITNAREIIAVVTTPFSLAALFLLILSGIILKISSQKNEPGPQRKILSQIVKYSFITAIILSLSANFISLFTTVFNRDAKLSGLIHNGTGKTIKRAIIDIVGIGRSVTDDNGTFSYSIPQGRKSNHYDISIIMDGYEPFYQSYTGSELESLRIRLSEKTLDSTFIQIPDDISIGHYIGVPQVDFPLIFNNPTPFEIVVEDISVTLISPAGISKRLVFERMYMFPGDIMRPAINQLRIQEQGRWKAYYNYMGFNAEAQKLAQNVKLEIQNMPFINNPQQGHHILSEELTHRLETFLESNFYWIAGDWKIKVSCSVAGKKYSSIFKYLITDTEISNMKNIGKYYSTGAGAFFPIHNNQIRDAIPVFSTTLTRDKLDLLQ